MPESRYLNLACLSHSSPNTNIAASCALITVCVADLLSFHVVVEVTIFRFAETRFGNLDLLVANQFDVASVVEVIVQGVNELRFKLGSESISNAPC